MRKKRSKDPLTSRNEQAIRFNISQCGRSGGTEGTTFVVEGGIQSCEWLEGREEVLMCGKRFIGIFESKRRRRSLTKVLDLIAVAVATIPNDVGDLVSASKHTRNTTKNEIYIVSLHKPNLFLLWSLQISGGSKSDGIIVLARGIVDSLPQGGFPLYSMCAISPSANVMISPTGDLYVTKDSCGQFWASPPQQQLPEGGKQLASNIFRSIDVSIPPLHNCDAYTNNPDQLSARQACPILVATITPQGSLFIYRAYDIHASGARRNKLMESTSKSTAVVFKLRLTNSSFVDLVFHPNRRVLFTTTLKTIKVYSIKVTGDRRTEADDPFSSDDEDVKSWAKEVGSPIITIRQKVEVYTGGVHTAMTCSKNGKLVGIAHTCGRVCIRRADDITVVVWDVQLFNSPITSFSVSSPLGNSKTVKLVAIDHEGTLKVKELPTSGSSRLKAVICLFVFILFMKAIEILY